MALGCVLAMGIGDDCGMTGKLQTGQRRLSIFDQPKDLNSLTILKKFNLFEMMKWNLLWSEAKSLLRKSFTCGYCGALTASNEGYHTRNNLNGLIYICNACSAPTCFFAGKQTPGPSFGSPIQKLPSEINTLYEEIRSSMSIGSFTLAVLGARKILMNVAVYLGADERLTFKEYVDWLVLNNHVTVRNKDWVDHIREKSNDANHEIPLMTPEEAATVLKFVEMLLKLTFEYPESVPKSPQ